METILFLSHTEADGTLGRGALEALGAARSLAGSLPGSAFVAGLTGASVQPAANQIAGCGAARCATPSPPPAGWAERNRHGHPL